MKQSFVPFAIRLTPGPLAWPGPKGGLNPIKRLMSGLTIMAAVLSMVLATSLPAQADRRGDDLAKALAVALILGLVIHEVGKGHDKPRPQPVTEPRVPVDCAVAINVTAYNSTVVYPRQCLRAEGFNHPLPDCGRKAWIYGHRDTVYTADCLRSAGYRVSGRR